MAERTSGAAASQAGLTGWLRRLIGGRNGDNLRDAVAELLDADEDDGGRLSRTERGMLVNLLEFGELRVDDVMVPRADIVAVEEAATIDQVVEMMRRRGHSRLPVYRGTLDDVVGMVHVRDLLDDWGVAPPGPSIASLLRRVLFVPPSMSLIDLLIQMRASHIHMALVVDEYGGTDGLATIEDLVEPIVGEIWDEHDTEERHLLTELPGGVVEASARTRVEELERRTGLDLLPDAKEEGIDTLGGLVFDLLGRVPTRGELIRHDSGLEFEVVDADPRRIKRVRVRGVPPRPPE